MKENNPIMLMLQKIADVVLLNLLVLLGCIPIVTIGASMTAGHFAALRIRRDEGTVARDFWRSFKENFKQATVIWLVMFVISAGVFAVLWFFGKSSMPLRVLCFVLLLVLYFIALWVYPLLSRFVNSTGNTIRNALLISVSELFCTFGMGLITLAPILACILTMYALPFIFLIGLSGPMYISAGMYNSVFKQMEETVLETNNQKNVEQQKV